MRARSVGARSAAEARSVLAEIPGVASALVDVRTLAQGRRLPVSDGLAPLFGHRPPGLVRGWRHSVAGAHGVEGAGHVSLAFALVAEAMGQGSWTAVVDAPWLGLAAVEAFDIPLQQLVLIDRVDSHWGSVMASLIDGFDIVMFAGRSVGVRDARRISAHAREKGAVLVQLGATGWPESADIQFEVDKSVWSGLGPGHGHLTSRLVSVSVAGRRGHVRTSQVPLWLPDAQGHVRVADPSERAEFASQAMGSWAGSDIDLLVEQDRRSGLDDQPGDRHRGAGEEGACPPPSRAHLRGVQ